jgi:hypothetical protein
MSARNNEDRFGAVPSQEVPPQAVEASDTSGESAFSYVVPTEHVELPSEGVYYPTGHPLHNQATVEIKYMTAKEEDILTSQSLLKKGIALDRLLQNILIDKRIKPQDLLIGDKNALLIASRITGYGSDYNVNVTCPMCGTQNNNDFDLDEAKRTKPSQILEGIIHESENLFSTTLPQTKAKIQFAILTGLDEKRILNTSEIKRKKNLPESSFTDQLRIILRNVNGSDRPEHINQFIETLPTRDGRHLRKAMLAATPDVELKCEYDCTVCGHREEVDLPLTAEFFWPKQ